ncbi:MAG: sensor histidine kinase, partial [Planctomycetota bacterium]
MRLQTKVLVVAIALAVVVSGAMLALINYQLDQHVQSLEGTLAREAYVRARLLINARLAEVQRAAMRLATGAAARLLEQGDNTLPAAGKLAADDLHLLVVARIVKGGKLELLHVVAHTPQGGDVEPGALVAWQQPLDLLNFGRAPRSGLAIGPAGAIELASVPVIVARNGASDTRPAVSADDPGHVVAGSLLVGRLVQANGHSAWERALGQTVLLSPTQPPDEHAATATDDDPLLRIVEAETIAAGAPVQDIRAQPSLWLETRTRRSVFISGQASNAGAMVGLVFGGLVLTMSFIGVLRMLVLRRLSRLARAAAQVRHAGDLVRRIDDDSTDEVGQLVRAFNTMLDRLDEQAEQARGTNRELVTALQARDELLHTLSHELRTPLATIRGFAERLQSMTGSGPAATGGPAPKEIERAVDHLLGLINDLLDLARARAGRLEVTLGPVDIMDALDDVMAMLRVQAEARGLSLEALT